MKNDSKRSFDSLNLEEMINVTFLGEGGFSKVYLVATRDNKLFALKCIDKNVIVNNDMEESIVNVASLMKTLSFPFILTLFQTFKDEDRIFFLTEFI